MWNTQACENARCKLIQDPKLLAELPHLDRDPVGFINTCNEEANN